MVAAKGLKLFKCHPSQKTLQDIINSLTTNGIVDLSGYILLSDNILDKILHYEEIHYEETCEKVSEAVYLDWRASEESA